MEHETAGKTIKVTLLLCLVCSILVSSVSVLLKPKQMRNVQLDIERIILNLAELTDDAYVLTDKQVSNLYKKVTPKLVNLKSGKFIEETATGINVSTYNQLKAAKDPNSSIKLSADEDIASIKRQANVAKVYIIKNDNKISTIILPVHGYGLWSTMYGFIALAADLNTVKGLSFFSHAETPGLGGEVDNPKWKALWHGKQVYDNKGEVALHLVKQRSKNNIIHEIDALSGASMTSKGVTNLIKFWLGDQGFKPFLKNIHNMKEGSLL